MIARMADESGTPIDRLGQCTAWMRYFLGSRQGLPRTTLQGLIWDAHTASLMHTARVNRAELERAGADAPLEYNFWASWMEITILLDDPGLEAPEHALLRQAVVARFGSELDPIPA